MSFVIRSSGVSSGPSVPVPSSSTAFFWNFFSFLHASSTGTMCLESHAAPKPNWAISPIVNTQSVLISA